MQDYVRYILKWYLIADTVTLKHNTHSLRFSRMLFLQWGGGRWTSKSNKILKVSRLVKLEFRLSQRHSCNRYIF